LLRSWKETAAAASAAALSYAFGHDRFVFASSLLSTTPIRMTWLTSTTEIACMAASSRFLLLGEPLALDLTNTHVRRGGVDVDLLDSPLALTAWLAAEVDRLPWSGASDAADLLAVRALRDAIAELLRARRDGVRPASMALRQVNAALLTAAASRRLVWAGSGPRLAPSTLARKRDALLHVLAVDALGLLTGRDADALRTCAHPDCVLQFVARNPRRRWCSTELCGNRARVARHYRRERDDR
jgi:predicted RNA-binding Zn ribbon-like protein